MKETYTRTLFHEDLTKLNVKLYLSAQPKWEEGEDVLVETTGLKSWDLIQGGTEAEEIEKDLPEIGYDEYHEYLVLHYENGETATYRNSHVIMFIH